MAGQRGGADGGWTMMKGRQRAADYRGTERKRRDGEVGGGFKRLTRPQNNKEKGLRALTKMKTRPAEVIGWCGKDGDDDDGEDR